VKGGAECPTLLHFVARVLLRTDPTLVTFLEDMPHIEAAARGELPPYETDSSNLHVVSVSGLMSSISTLVSGLDLLQVELKKAKAVRVLPAGDRFIDVMEVKSSVLNNITPPYHWLTVLQAIYTERAGDH
jgi:diaphanous 1